MLLHCWVSGYMVQNHSTTLHITGKTLLVLVQAALALVPTLADSLRITRSTWDWLSTTLISCELRLRFTAEPL